MISYTSVNRALADEIHEQLKKKGCEPVIDHVDIRTGERWRTTIAWWLSTCQVAIVLLSRKALESPWVRYELSVLTNREQRGSVRLIPVWIGVRPEAVRDESSLDPFQLGEIQSYHYLATGADDDEVTEAIKAIVADLDAIEGDTEAPVHLLVPRAIEEVEPASSSRVGSARAKLAGPDVDPGGWPNPSTDAIERAFAEAYLASPIADTYQALQMLAQDRGMEVQNLHALVDLHVMTTFAGRDLEQLNEAGNVESRRAMVSSITIADLADVAALALPELHDSFYPYRFVVNSPVTGTTAEEVAQGLACELRRQIAVKVEEAQSVEDYLAVVARHRHPVFAFLAKAAGMHGEALRRLEELFPTVTFVVLSSDGQSAPDLARALGLDGANPAFDDPGVWASHVKNQSKVASERDGQRKALSSLKKAMDT